MKVLNVNKLINMLREYQDIPKNTKTKQRLLQIRLCNPMIAVEDAISAFISTENEINYLIKKWHLISKIITNLDDVDIQIVDGLMNEKSIFDIADEIKISRRTITRKIEKISQNFLKKVTFEFIYE